MPGFASRSTNMPIYAYRCAECGHSKDVLRKISDPPLTTCPACGADAFNKQLTAAGFQLKGSGWYVTDFRDGAKGKKDGGDAKPAADKPATDKPAADKPAETPAKSGDGGGSSSSGGGGADGGGSSSAASAAPCGGSCAGH
jgi:putative FmdB family regulatory protein